MKRSRRAQKSHPACVSGWCGCFGMIRSRDHDTGCHWRSTRPRHARCAISADVEQRRDENALGLLVTLLPNVARQSAAWALTSDFATSESDTKETSWVRCPMAVGASVPSTHLRFELGQLQPISTLPLIPDGHPTGERR